MSDSFEDFSEEYFLNLARKIYLSPEKEVLDRCVSFASEIQSDLLDLMSLDTTNLEIFYNLPQIEISLKTEQPGLDVENKEILKSLLDSYELQNISSKE